MTLPACLWNLSVPPLSYFSINSNRAPAVSKMPAVSFRFAPPLEQAREVPALFAFEGPAVAYKADKDLLSQERVSHFVRLSDKQMLIGWTVQRVCAHVR